MAPRLATNAGVLNRSPERQHLADRIARVTELTQALDRVRQARAKIGPTWEASAGVERAEEKLKEAQEGEPRRLVDEILGRGSAKSTVADAEAALAAAKAEEARRRSMHALLDEEERATQASLDLAEMRCRDALREVLAADPAVSALHREYETARQRVANLQRQCFEVRAGLEPHWDIRPAPSPDGGVEQPWRAAVEALSRDPDAALPEPDDAVEPPRAA